MRRITAWALAALATGLSIEAHAQSVPAASDKEALVIVVTQWTGGCSGSRRTSWDDMIDAWYDDFTDTRAAPSGHGTKAWSRDGFYQNGTIVDSQFTDGDIVAYGNDDANDNADDVDAMMVGMHGGHNSGVPNSWLGTVRVDEAGGGSCWAYQAEMDLGDLDLEFLHLSSCHSMCDLNEGWTNWESSFEGLHQVNGFYGLMWIDGDYTGRYKGFSDDAFDISIADSWLDNHHWNWPFADGFLGLYDHCPVSMVAGTSASNASTRASNEEYDWVYADPTAPYFYYYVSVAGCDPKDHEP